jgi:hypothetical protein
LFVINMNVHVPIDFTVPTTGVAEILTDTKSSVRVSQPRDNPRRLVVDLTIPKARQGDVVDRIGRENEEPQQPEEAPGMI